MLMQVVVFFCPAYLTWLMEASALQSMWLLNPDQSLRDLLAAEAKGACGARDHEGGACSSSRRRMHCSGP